MLSEVNVSVYPRPGKEHVSPGAVWGEGAAKPASGEQKKHQLVLVKTGFSPVGQAFQVAFYFPLPVLRRKVMLGQGAV